ncbi:hypothetical protein SAMN05443549_105252 [Flavobacterium fluvii]|uniref:Glycosyl-4,4'-diaponeurosporenoate acyltransferase n=1 Tax=Flavobacterium fluvii TaxID=468056 RepID=A0A1M5LKV9_9FLAO|nr:hypothetical protein [Flavobacterium fluvii]SHG65681.1 hypothetical protein SAMN05443549_105252 [Flavobacterium fluvii]
MQFNIIIDTLDKFARENTFLSMMILAILGNLLYDIFKKLMYYTAVSTKNATKSTGKVISKWNRKNIEYLIKNYKEDIIKVEKVKNNEQVMYYELLHDLHHNLLMFFTILILYFIVLKLDNPILFYGLLGASSRYLISIFASIYYRNTLFENARNFDKYKLKKEKRILLLEKIL